MGSNHFNKFFKDKKKIPTYDPYTGQLNPYYKELTGEDNPDEVLKKEKEISEFESYMLELEEKYKNSNSEEAKVFNRLIKLFKEYK
jgi:hypothetical protein